MSGTDARYVYELLIDYDGTTRSHAESEGLYISAFAAQKAYNVIKLRSNILGRHTIERRYVYGSS